MYVLVINCGSSSVKYELFDPVAEKNLASGIADRIGVETEEGASLQYRLADGKTGEFPISATTHHEAVATILDLLQKGNPAPLASLQQIGAVGHRVVHGGEHFSESVVIDKDVIGVIEGCAELAPLHNPPNLQGIHACLELIPGVPQVAVFDTAFHATMPRHAYLYALPLELAEELRIRRYGFHGTSHRYVSQVAQRYLVEKHGPYSTGPKIITCHLGNGCSMAAVEGGKVMDTSMGFTPLEGLVMGTRSGDLDPALIFYICEKKGMTPHQVNDLLNKHSGLLGLSGSSNDMRDLLARAEDGDARAKVAVDVFCYRVRKYIGAYVAVLGGLDALVFTAGIGQHAPTVRAQICRGLEGVGVVLDQGKNAAASDFGSIAAGTSRAEILVIPTNEELVIARDAARLAGLLPSA